MFLNRTVILNFANITSDGVIMIPEGSDLVIDASQTQFLATTIPRREITFNVSCANNSLVRTIDCQFN
jgi:hypothetical protein